MTIDEAGPRPEDAPPENAPPETGLTAPPTTARPTTAPPTTGPEAGSAARTWDDRGMATVEYAIATVAAAGFAGLLLVILRSDEVRGMLLEIIRSALAFG